MPLNRPETLTEKRRAASLARKSFAPGGKHWGKKRCPCGAETLRRALARWPARAGKCPKCPVPVG